MRISKPLDREIITNPSSLQSAFWVFFQLLIYMKLRFSG